MLRWTIPAILATLPPAGGAQEPPAGEERLRLLDRAELRGRAASLDSHGAIVFEERNAGRSVRVAPEEVARIEFPGTPASPGLELVRLRQGGALSGILKGADPGLVLLQHPAGLLRIARDQVRSIQLSALAGAMPEIRDDPFDVLVVEEDGKEPQAEYGRLKEVGAAVVFASMAGEARSYARASVRQILLRGPAAAEETPAGWFAKLVFRNGDRVVGALRSITPGRVGIWSPAFGAIEADKRDVQSLSFVTQARLSIGRLLVCDQAGVRELDRAGRELWTYGSNAQYAWSARKLENGNVLVANTNFNQVLEIQPKGRSGGEVVWRLEQANYPYDAIRLENGNTMVAEYAVNRVVEYDARTGAPATQFAVNHPVSLQSLENGSTLVASAAGVVELDRRGQVTWRLVAAGVRPHRASRLENGNTLVVDHLRGQVTEFDPSSKRVWSLSSLQRPVQAIRLEDGNTLILEQGNNRIIEVDPSNPKKPVLEIKGLQYPQGMSVF
jgi:hypothetical protein